MTIINNNAQAQAGHNSDNKELHDIVLDMLKNARKASQARGAVFADTVVSIYIGLRDEVLDKQTVKDYLTVADTNESTGSQTTRLTKILEDLGIVEMTAYGTDGKEKPALVGSKLDGNGEYLDPDDSDAHARIKVSIQRNAIVGFMHYVRNTSCSVTKTNRFLMARRDIVEDLTEIDEESYQEAAAQTVQVGGKGSKVIVSNAIDQAWDAAYVSENMTRPAPKKRGPKTKEIVSNPFHDTATLLRNYLANGTPVSDDVMIDIMAASSAILAYRAAHLAQWEKIENDTAKSIKAADAKKNKDNNVDSTALEAEMLEQSA